MGDVAIRAENISKAYRIRGRSIATTPCATS